MKALLRVGADVNSRWVGSVSGGMSRYFTVVTPPSELVVS